MKHRLRNRIALAVMATLPLIGVSGASSLDSLFARGDSSIAITWTPDSINTRPDWYTTYGSTCTGEDSIYRHCDFLPGETYTSVAYSYGGEDGYLRFREKLAEGFLVGSHLCHYTNFGDPSPVVAGTDCSGFICYLLGAPRVSTREFYSQYDVISREEMNTGDILVKSGSHAVIIIEKEDADNFLIWESTSVVNGCRERMIDITDSYWDAYYPRRYPKLATSVRKSTPRYPSFPVVTAQHGRLYLDAPFNWSGSIAVFTLSGKCLFSAVRNVGGGTPELLTAISSHATVVVRFISREGGTHMSPFTILP
ncbi:MAG: hypothetical protein JW863_00970 [Chitinispirillaceae bacterium]|nr:hypothetical protein [Chitinispirillaceae bacterium]